MHKHVLADVRKILDELGIQPAEFSARYIDAKGEARTECRLLKDLTITLVSDYSVTMRHRIVTRWMGLPSFRLPPQVRGCPQF